MLACCACIVYTMRMQYTIRGVPPAVDTAIRRRARAAGKSLNQVAVEALWNGAGVGEVRRVRRDLSDIVGTWRRDRALEEALAAQDAVDEEIWR
jgi:hypothetical protein